MIQNLQVSNTIDKAMGFIEDIGRASAASLFPYDFEYYLLSLELVKTDRLGIESVVRYFSFPVMPNSITQSEPQITNIKKTYGGITAINTNSFIPKDINIQGNFGRMFRITLNSSIDSFTSLDLTGGTDSLTVGGIFNVMKKMSAQSSLLVGKRELVSFVKSGYGSLKILQAICESSTLVENDVPYKLFLHNPALGQSYLVKVMNFSPNQNMSQNMVWGYTLSLKAIAPMEAVRSSLQNTLSDALAIGMIQKGISKLVSGIGNMVKNLV